MELFGCSPSRLYLHVAIPFALVVLLDFWPLLSTFVVIAESDRFHFGIKYIDPYIAGPCLCAAAFLAISYRPYSRHHSSIVKNLGFHRVFHVASPFLIDCGLGCSAIAPVFPATPEGFALLER